MSIAPVSPYIVSVRELLRRPGEMRESELTFEAPEQLGEGAAAVPESEQVDVELRLESLHDGILASGRVTSTARGECVRCLDPVELDVDVTFQELFSYEPDDAVDFTVEDDAVDLEPLVRDAIVLALPFQPLCDPDCPGLDPETGEKRSSSADGPAEEGLDPRWAALEDFRVDGED